MSERDSVWKRLGGDERIVMRVLPGVEGENIPALMTLTPVGANGRPDESRGEDWVLVGSVPVEGAS